MPSGVFHENIVNIIGNGVALDIRKFINEYNSIKEQYHDRYQEDP